MIKYRKNGGRIVEYEIKEGYNIKHNSVSIKKNSKTYFFYTEETSFLERLRNKFIILPKKSGHKSVDNYVPRDLVEYYQQTENSLAMYCEFCLWVKENETEFLETLKHCDYELKD